jgi:hypothetical protein
VAVGFFFLRFSRSAFRENLFSFSKLLLVAVVKGGQRLGSRKRRIGSGMFAEWRRNFSGQAAGAFWRLWWWWWWFSFW